MAQFKAGDVLPTALPAQTLSLLQRGITLSRRVAGQRAGVGRKFQIAQTFSSEAAMPVRNLQTHGSRPVLNETAPFRQLPPATAARRAAMKYRAVAQPAVRVVLVMDPRLDADRLDQITIFRRDYRPNRDSPRPLQGADSLLQTFQGQRIHALAHQFPHHLNRRDVAPAVLGLRIQPDGMRPGGQ